MNSHLLNAAMAYGERKLYVFPVQVKGKTPLTSHGFKDASVDPAVIKRWWTQWPNANIGIATGQVSGFWVLDIDGDEGEVSLKNLEKQYGPIPPSVDVITGGGGRHLYFQYPDGIPIPNSASRLGPGLDVRGDGGYVVAPPSIHPSGRQYEWSVDAHSGLTSAPEWLLELVIAKPTETIKKSPTDWVSLTNGVEEGSRNDSLARMVGKLLGHGIDPHFAFYLLLAWNDVRCKPPLSYEEFERTFVSIAKLEAQKRGVR